MDWKRFEFVACGEIEYLTLKAQKAFFEIEMKSSSSNPEAIHIHMLIDDMLAAASQITSHIYPRGWDAKKKPIEADFSLEAAARLRDLLSIGDEPILRCKAVRNHNVHFDERLQRWLLNSANRTYGRHMLGSISDIERLKIKSEDVLALFDVKDGTYVFWEDKVNIFDLGEKLLRVRNAARKYMATAEWNGLRVGR